MTGLLFDRTVPSDKQQVDGKLPNAFQVSTINHSSIAENRWKFWIAGGHMRTEHPPYATQNQRLLWLCTSVL